MVITRSQYNNQFKVEAERLVEFTYNKFSHLHHDYVVPSTHNRIKELFNYNSYYYHNPRDFKGKSSIKKGWKKIMIWCYHNLLNIESVFSKEERNIELERFDWEKGGVIRYNCRNHYNPYDCYTYNQLLLVDLSNPKFSTLDYKWFL